MECLRIFKIMNIQDDDGDIVKCRWANTADECGKMCQALSGSTLDEESCILHYTADKSTGWYAVALQIEDFATSTSTVPLSSVSLQFLIKVFMSDGSCAVQPEIIPVDVSNGQSYNLMIGILFSRQIVAESSPGGSCSITEINLVAPIGIVKSPLQVFGSSGNQWSTTIQWTPTADQLGGHLFCYSASDSEGAASSQSCINLIVYETLPTTIEPTATTTEKTTFTTTELKTTTEPATTTTASETTTTEPETTTTASETTTTEPETTTTGLETTTTETETTTTASETTTTEPETTTTGLETTTTEPETTTGLETTTKLLVTTTEPLITTTEKITTDPKVTTLTTQKQTTTFHLASITESFTTTSDVITSTETVPTTSTSKSVNQAAAADTQKSSDLNVGWIIGIAAAALLMLISLALSAYNFIQEAGRKKPEFNKTHNRFSDPSHQPNPQQNVWHIYRNPELFHNFGKIPRAAIKPYRNMKKPV